ncbi:DUF5694 domain-containing protein [Sphingomonas sp. Leaf4]|uniref:DUF5694 domain-containing protein n=1 Tax=Sphingomonas sp. Leaf4 TaxID=2876553 RepID=UPI001E44EA4D|nr:DUF5694 domain-containing protein [Sphingomonas sp. Leaf4]
MPSFLPAALIGATLLLAPDVAAQESGYRPTFRPETLKRTGTANPNIVMVLGTTHLANLPKSFQPAVLGPLLDRLAAWKPTAIATEDLSGLQCDALRRYPSRYAETVETYCYDPTPANTATGLDVPAANAEGERLVAALGKAPTPAQRRRLAAVWLAAGERFSALVQWLRLPPPERRAGDGLDAPLVAMLTELAGRRGESSQISAVLAARLGLERTWSVDDHSADTQDDPDPAVRKATDDAVVRAWDNPASRQRRANDERLTADLGTPGGVLALYRSMNGPDAPALVYRSDFGAALAAPAGLGRGYVGYWETRNLRMVANMRDVLGRTPGTRMLAVVGASHKGYYEAYLHQMHDVTLADVMPLLRE